jgi:trehalose 6-phosphate synthase
MNSQDNGWKLEPASFVVVANRLPVDRVERPDGTADWRPSPGGLVTAFDPIMHKRRGAWVGWHGAPDEKLEPFEDDGLTLVPVPLSTTEVEQYYEGFSNATLWPLYHDAIATPQFHREWWDSHVNGSRIAQQRLPLTGRSCGFRTTTCSLFPGCYGFSDLT